MKKDRNCGMASYPVYPMNNMMPMPNQMGMPMMGNMPMGVGPGMATPGIPNPNMMNQGMMMPGMNNESSMSSQLNSLEKRVARLEGMMSANKNSTYSESNFYMV